MSTAYEQLCGALGLLKINGAELPWESIDKQLQDIGRRLGIAVAGDPLTGGPATGIADPVYAEIRLLHRRYRNECLERGLIKVGELFNKDDCVPLVRRFFKD